MNKNNYCVIMAGGIGSRFWPMSRNAFPKQFLDILDSGKTLLQQTYNRFTQICPKENILIVTNESYVDLVKKNLPDLPVENILGEPLRRNTAPCVSYAAFKIASKNPDANIIVAPSDHVITKEDAFIETVKEGLNFTRESDCLLTIGITPSRPDTGYGYIQFVDDKKNSNSSVFKVKTFTEKPNLEMAQFFLKTGEFVWNAGIFMWNVKSILKALKNYLPDMYHIFEEGKGKYYTDNETEFVKRAYSQCTNISIDFGIMEKASNVYVMKAEFGWSDLGTYGSLYEHLPHDAAKNAVVGKNVMLYDSSNCVVSVPHEKLVVLQGLNDYIVVESENILLVCRKQDEQQIRQFVNDVKTNKGEKFV